MTDIEFCNKMLGVQWVRRGESFDGVDCWGLVLLSFRALNKVELPQVEGYADPYMETEDAARGQHRLSCYQECAPQDGAIMAVFNTHGDINHVGRCLCGRVLHATSAMGVRFDTYGAIKQRYGRLVRYFRYVG